MDTSMEKMTYLTNQEKLNNYEMVCENWRKIFLDMDQDKLAERFCLEEDKEALYIIYYGDRYQISKTTGVITLQADPARKLTFNTLMAIYGLFYYTKEDPRQSGDFVPYRLVKRAAPFAPAFQKTVVDVLARIFNGKSQAMEDACKALGGIPRKQGDVGYQIKAFDCIPVEVYFWDGDEEFEAQANILFDSEVTDYLHEESVCMIGSDLVRVLTERAGLGDPEHLLGNEY